MVTRKYSTQLINGGAIPTILIKAEYLRNLPIIATDNDGNKYIGGNALVHMLNNHKLMESIGEELMHKRNELKHRERMLDEDESDERYQG